jgi:hypothetical protein
MRFGPVLRNMAEVEIVVFVQSSLKECSFSLAFLILPAPINFSVGTVHPAGIS